ERAGRLATSEPPLWRALTIFYTDANEFARAAEFEERWGRTPGADRESGLRHCRLRVRAGDSKRAPSVCLQAIATGESLELQQLLGDAYQLAGDPPKAVEAYQRAIRLDPSEAGSYLKLVTLFLDHRTPLPAIAVLGNVLPQFPKHAELRRLLGLAYYQT